MGQISYIKYKDILEARRYDAEYFKPEYLEIEKKINSTNSDFLSNLSDNKYQNYNPKNDGGYFDYIEISNINLETGEYVKERILNSQQPSRAKKICNKFDLLISTVRPNRNAVSLILEDQDKLIASTGFCKLRKIKVNPYYLFVLFKTNDYIKLLDRKTTATQYPTVNENDILNLKIPILSKLFQLQIEHITKSAHQKQTQSKQFYREAEKLLLVELGLLDYQIKHSLTFSTTKKEVGQAHRYDSEYFQPKYVDIIKKIEGYEGGWDLVKNAINFKDKNYTPKNDQKYKYLALSNISSQGYIQDYQEEFGKDLPSRAKRKINTNDLIISSIEGSLSSCALVEKEFDNSICSTGFFILNSKKINSETLLILFKSPVIQELLQRGSKGTILTAISKTELESIKIPLIRQSIQKQIAEKIQESHRLRNESKELLEEAKRKVEEEIEK